MMCVQAGSRYTKKTAQAGFSLIELMIYIAIIGILGAVIVPRLMERQEKARISSARQTMKAFDAGIEMFQLDLGVIPRRLEDLVRKPSPSQYYPEEKLNEWQKRGYLKKDKIPLDPWGKKYQYKLTPEAKNPYELFTYTKDRRKISVWD